MEDTAVLAEMIRDAQNAPEPGVSEEVISKGTEEQPALMIQLKPTSAGFAWVWDTRTGTRSTCNKNNLLQMLRKKRDDGSLVFTTRKPDIEPFQGTYLCPLHKDYEYRGHFDELGLPVCPKDNLLSPFHVKRHMQKRHRVEWDTIESERIDKERLEEREFQRSVMEKATQEKPPLYVSEKDKNK